MSGANQDKSAPEKSTGVTIDRLVLDIPGLSPAEAPALAQQIGERLALAGISGERPRIGVTLGPIGGSESELAARIVAALVERLV